MKKFIHSFVAILFSFSAYGFASTDTTVLAKSVTYLMNSSSSMALYGQANYYYNAQGTLDSEVTGSYSSGSTTFTPSYKYRTVLLPQLRQKLDTSYSWSGGRWTIGMFSNTTQSFLNVNGMLDSTYDRSTVYYQGNPKLKHYFTYDTKGRVVLDTAFDWTGGGGIMGESITPYVSYHTEWNDAKGSMMKRTYTYRQNIGVGGSSWREYSRDSCKIDAQSHLLQRISIADEITGYPVFFSNREDYVYDANGRKIWMIQYSTDTSHVVWSDSVAFTKYIYDASGRLIREDFARGLPADTATFTGTNPKPVVTYQTVYTYATISMLPAAVAAPRRVHLPFSKLKSDQWDLLGRFKGYTKIGL